MPIATAKTGDSEAVRLILPAGWKSLISAEAADNDQLPAEWMRDAIRSHMSKERRKKLPEPRGRGKPKKPPQ